MGVDVLTSIEKVAKTSCGYATVFNVTSHELSNRMESFFLSETTKYLYLLFDEENFINELPGDRPVPRPHFSPSGTQCYPEMGGYIFNTEAHPIDPGALNCCFVDNSADSISFTESSVTSEENGSDTSKLENDFETLRLQEDEFNPLNELLDAIDSASRDSQIMVPGFALSQPSNASCFTQHFVDFTSLEPWTELREIVLQGFSSLQETTVFSNRSFNVPVFDDLHSIQPKLLTCPFPPFHQRYTLSGQLVTSTN